MPSRKRKGRQLERAPKRAPGPRILRQITSNPDIDPLLIPLVHRPAELMLHSIVSLCTMLRGHGVFRTWRDFVTPHPSVKDDDSINWWHRPVDLVCSADDHLKWTPLGKKNRHYMAAQELRYLVRYMHTGTSLRPAHPDWAEAKPEQRPARYQAMIIRFWRNLHRLLRRDLVWSGHGHVYVTKYILDFGFAVADTCGAEHPLQRLLFALSQASNADLQDMLRSGASWMLGQLAPAFGEKLEGKRNFIIHVWTDGLYW